LAVLSDPTATARVEAAQASAREFVAELYRHVPVLDTGARGSTNTFVNGIGDVLLAWENEALLAIAEFGEDSFDVIVPPISILAEPPVTWVDRNTERNATTDVARAYLEFLFSDTAQVIAAKHFYRPRNEAALTSFPGRFPELRLVTIDGVFGGWQRAQAEHFADGGIFDQVYGAAP
jgi:sulfate transport system substrate-binding protein